MNLGFFVFTKAGTREMERRRFTSGFKTKVVLELLRGERELDEIASAYEIAPNQLRNWKTVFLDNADIVLGQPFARGACS